MEVETATSGVFELPKGAATLAPGQFAYWSNNLVGGSGDLLIGVVIAAAEAGSTTCRVRLNPAFVPEAEARRSPA